MEMCGDPNAYGVLMAPKSPEFLRFLRDLAKDPARVVARAASHSKKLYKKPSLTAAEIEEAKQAAEKAIKDFSGDR